MNEVDSVKCLEKINELSKTIGVFQEFQFEQNKTTHEIMECFDIVKKEDIINIGYAIDYLLYHYVNESVSIAESLTQITADPITSKIYINPIKSLSASATNGVNYYINLIEHKNAFIVGDDMSTLLSIITYQLYLLLFNFAKKYEEIYIHNIKNTQSLIYLLLTTPIKTWETLKSVMDSVKKSNGFKGYHHAINISDFLGDIKKNKESAIKLCKNYTFILGLYFSYQMSKSTTLAAHNDPIYPTTSFYVEKPNIDSPVNLNKIKTPFKVKHDLNTFPMPKNKHEISVTPLSELDPNDKYEPLSNLVTLEELQSYIATDLFVNDLIKSEMKLMHYKMITYNRMKKDIDNNLTSGENTIDPKIKQKLEKKKQVINIILSIIKSRLDKLKIKTNEQKIKDKREILLDIVNNPEDGIISIKSDSRENIRRYLYSQIYIFAKAPELFIKSFMNYTLMGPAGAGKTKVATVLAYVYNHLGILASDDKNGKFLVVTRADLVGGTIGSTAPKTRDYLEKMLEGVLLIDEAYQLSTCPDINGKFSNNDFGQESITEIINYIDKNIGLSVIIAAGYEDKITKCFLAINEGIKRRFPNNMRLMTYSSKDLYEIFISFVTDKFGDNYLTPLHSQYIKKMIETLNDDDPYATFEGEILFSNQAGDMLNLSSQILEDLILFENDEYTISDINQSFQKFFANKGIYIDFESN